MVSSRKLTVGGETVSYCTKCRMDLNHRIIAMVEGVPVKVECLTCHSHHKYRRPMEERGSEPRASRAASSVSSSRTGSSSSGTRSRSAAARAVAEAAEENERERVWQSKIAGKMSASFKPYTPKASFDEGDLLQHAKFGDGYVMRVIDVHKIEVMFRDGPKVLAQGLTMPS